MEQDHLWKIRDGNEKDLPDILSLRRLVFGEMEKDKLDPRFWTWQFLEGPDGRAFIYLVEDENQVIGHFADVPRRFSVQGQTVLGTLSLDLMVHPDYRRRGIFGQMGRYGIGRVKEKEGLFMTAYPIRKETIQGLKRMGWKEVTKLPVLVYPIRFGDILNRYLHFSPLSSLAGAVARMFYSFFFGRKPNEKGEGINIDEVRQLDERFDQFWKRARSLHQIMGVRDRKFLEWRFFQHPTRHYTLYRLTKRGEMLGYVVLTKMELLKFNTAVIVDLLALDHQTLAALVERGIEYSRTEGADLLGYMVPELHPYYHRLKRMGFLPSLKTFLFMVYPHFDEKISLEPKDWHVNWGDADVI